MKILLWHIQLINDVSDILHLPSGYHSGWQILIKNICIMNTSYGNKAILAF